MESLREYIAPADSQTRVKTDWFGFRTRSVVSNSLAVTLTVIYITLYVLGRHLASLQYLIVSVEEIDSVLVLRVVMMSHHHVMLYRHVMVGLSIPQSFYINV